MIGNLCIANRNASRAISSVTPATSNNIVPFLTTATQASGLPFPDPIRTSAGFLVRANCGKIRTQTFPSRFIERVIATLAASI